MRQAYTTTCSKDIFKGRSKRSRTRRKNTLRFSGIFFQRYRLSHCMRLTTKLHGSSCVLVVRSCLPTAGSASSRMAWLHMYSLAFSYGTHPCTTPYCTCSVRREATCSLSYEQTQVHPLPSLVLAREATGCVTDFASHANAYLQCRRKILHCATWHFVPHAYQIAPAGGTRSESPHCISSIRFRRAASP